MRQTTRAGTLRVVGSQLDLRLDPPTIVVPLDGTSQALTSLPVAKVLAALLGATLHVVHVAERTFPPREVLETLGLGAEELHGSVIDQLTGTPCGGILQVVRERQSRLLVMSAHAGVVEPEGELGAVAKEVLQKAPCPAVLVRPERGLHPWTLEQIVLPYDGTPTAAAVIELAAELAHRAGAELAVLYVMASRARAPIEPGTFAAPRYVDQPQHEWPSWARQFLMRLAALGHLQEAVRLRLFLARGRPGVEIVRFAREHGSDLIVFGWHGRLETRRAETIKAVIRDAPCPIFIARVERHRPASGSLRT